MFPKAPDNWFNHKIRRGDGIFDRKSFEYTISACTKFRTALDIGAHVGTWSLGMAKRFENVLSFEPNEINYQFLKENTRNTENIQIKHCAMGDKNCHVSMMPGIENSGMSYVSLEQGDVPMMTVDYFIRESGYPVYEKYIIDLIKIDVEGFELPVLMGAKDTIERYKPVIMVELSGHGDRFGFPDKDVQDYLLSLGYTLFGKTNKDYVYRM